MCDQCDKEQESVEPSLPWVGLTVNENGEDVVYQEGRSSVWGGGAPGSSRFSSLDAFADEADEQAHDNEGGDTSVNGTPVPQEVYDAIAALEGMQLAVYRTLPYDLRAAIDDLLEYGG